MCMDTQHGFDEFLQKYKTVIDTVCHVFYRKTPSSVSFDEIRQTVLIGAFQIYRKHKEDLPNSYVYRRLSGVVLDFCREQSKISRGDRKRFQRNDAEIFVSYDDARYGDGFDDAHESELYLRDLIKRVDFSNPSRRRAFFIFVLHHVYGYMYKDIAKVYGISDSAAVRHVDNLLRHIRGEKYYEPPSVRKVRRCNYCSHEIAPEEPRCPGCGQSLRQMSSCTWTKEHDALLIEWLESGRKGKDGRKKKGVELLEEVKKIRPGTTYYQMMGRVRFLRDRYGIGVKK